jgi:peptidoglycan/xylan/chitin deacetylase (PgdA/CDA1 family)
MYHEILPDAVDIPYWSIVKESAFRRQMEYLRAHYEVLSLDDALSRVYSREAARPGARPVAVVTFDDGYSGNFTCALPIMRDLRLPFTVYVATRAVESGTRQWYDELTLGLVALGPRSVGIPTSRGVLAYSGRKLTAEKRWDAINEIHASLKELPADERQAITAGLKPSAAAVDLRMMTPNELRLLSREVLACIGCHTHGHDLLDQISQAEARATILRAQELLSAWTAREPRHFSYPNGNYSSSTPRLVQELGFLSAVTTEERRWAASDDRHTIPRIGIGRFDNLDLFRAKISGALT